jgi:type VI secretion system protein ImpI
MALRFNIENETNLPDGGPVVFTVTGKRSVDIGRDQHLDWTLPDPTRFISSKHCEVHFRDGGYWLHDVSTNGTFLNGADHRMRGPHRLRDGDKLVIGQYVVGVSLDSDGAVAPGIPAGFGAPVLQQHAGYQELWTNDREVAPPIDPQQLKIAREAARPVNPGFLDWAAGVPEPDALPVQRPSSRTPKDRPDQGDMSWANGSRPAPAPVEPPPAVPAPRRPLWTESDVSGDDPPAPAQRPAPAPAPPPQFSPAPARPVEAEKIAIQPVAINDSRATDAAASRAFARQLAKAAGLPEDFFANKNPDELSEQLGVILRMTVENLMVLLQARNEAKRLTRSTNQTMIQAAENNPLKFCPTPEEAMRIMFGPPTRSYLDARGAFGQGFNDLKSHQLKTYMAMQRAVTRLIADIAPEAIAQDIQEPPGVMSWLRSRKSRLWDAFTIRWKAHLGRDAGAPIDAFMLHFGDFYDDKDVPKSR